jgi:hypothetical protein
MAVLTPTQLDKIRQEVCRNVTDVNFTKPQINAAIQAVEDWFEANRPAISTAINTATSPLVLTVAQKKQVVAYWLLYKFDVERV